jgi:hypothetical protein
VIRYAFGECAVFKVTYDALIPAAERWRDIRITEFEQRQLKAAAAEINRDFTAHNATVTGATITAAPTRLSSNARTWPRPVPGIRSGRKNFLRLAQGVDALVPIPQSKGPVWVKLRRTGTRAAPPVNLQQRRCLRTRRHSRSVRQPDIRPWQMTRFYAAPCHSPTFSPVPRNRGRRAA